MVVAINLTTHMADDERRRRRSSSSNADGDQEFVENYNKGNKSSSVRKVMVIVDTNRESTATALQYALSHEIFENDRLVLLFIDNHNNHHHINSWKNPFSSIFKKQIAGFSAGNNNNNNNNSNDSLSLMTLETTTTTTNTTTTDSGAIHSDLIEKMKKICWTFKPKLDIVVEKVEITDGKDKASAILSESTKHGVELLIIGQKKSFSTALLGAKHGVSLSRGFDTAEILIENSKCNCIAVQKKGQNAGYLLSTKTHRNFWLLA